MGSCTLCAGDSSEDERIEVRLRNNMGRKKTAKSQYQKIFNDSDSEEYIAQQSSSSSTMIDNKPSNVSSRIELYQSKDTSQLNNKPNKQKKKSKKVSTTNKLKNMFEKINQENISSSTNTKKTTSVPKNKPSRKWKVKGIDVPHDRPDTEPIKSVSNTVESTDSVINRRTTDSLSLKERLDKYSEDVDSFDDRQRQRIDAHKQNRSGYHGIQISTEQKNKARDLLKKRLEKQKQTSLTSNNMIMGGMMPMSMNKKTVEFASAANTDIPQMDSDFSRPAKPGGRRKRRSRSKILDDDEDDDGYNVSSGGHSGTQTLSDILKNAKREDSLEIISNFGLFQAKEIIVNKSLSKKSDFNVLEKQETQEINFMMNNNNFLSRLTKEQQLKMYEIISYAIVDHPSKKCYNILMCNCGLNDTFMKCFCDIIISKWKEDSDGIFIRELWLESNPIGNEGFGYLSCLIAENIPSISVVKLYNNKKDISTETCDALIEALEKNTNIVKFVFKFRQQQQKDRLEKMLRRNQNMKRKMKKK